MLVFFVSRLYRGWWIHSGFPDLCRILVANVVASAGFAAAGSILLPSFPRSVYCIDFLLSFLLTAGARFAVRF